MSVCFALMFEILHWFRWKFRFLTYILSRLFPTEAGYFVPHAMILTYISAKGSFKVTFIFHHHLRGDHLCQDTPQEIKQTVIYSLEKYKLQYTKKLVTKTLLLKCHNDMLMVQIFTVYQTYVNSAILSNL